MNSTETSKPNEPAPDQGPKVPDQDLIRCIGRGSYGEVWLSRSLTGLYRAVKIVYRKRLPSSKAFEREFSGLQKFERISLGHPGMVALLQVGGSTEADHFYYVMELADDVATGQKIQPDTYEAKTLRSLISQRQRLPVSECLDIGISLADGLAHFQRNGLIHRDVKPSNIIFVNGLPKFADIGLVTEVDEPASWVGTNAYIPPEGPGGATSDLYSLGKVLYEISTGQCMDRFPELPDELLEGEESPALFRINQIMVKACAYYRQDRFASAQEMLENLRAVKEILKDGPKTIVPLPLDPVSVPDPAAPPSPSTTRTDLEPPGGAVPLDSPYYIERPTDQEFKKAIKRKDSIVLVKGPRQVGKTSLLARGLHHARQSGARVVLADFQKLDAKHLSSVEALFLKLSDFLADQLDLETLPGEAWDARRSPNTNFERYLRREVLGKWPGHLVWGLDEMDRLFGCPFANEVFALFRAWHNERALDPAGPWSRLTLVIAHATEAHLFINDINQSPFNVGTRLRLEDFTLEQVSDLNQRHGQPLDSEQQLQQFFHLLGGQPYLVRQALYNLSTGKCDFDTFIRHADRDEGIFGDHLRRIIVLLHKDEELCQAVRGILRKQPCTDTTAFYRLRSAGVMKGDSPTSVQSRCDLYETYLKKRLL